MTTFTLTLDWTPNINHIGFFVAQTLGFYSQENIKLEILNPLEDNYATTPGKKLELELADFAIAPFETVISLNNKQNRVDALAIYAILQEDLSSIAVLKSSQITSPKQLDGKSYASYKARYEDLIVKEMIKNDGGEATIKIAYPDKLGIWNTLLTGEFDATWIFDNWEGIEAASKQIELNLFKLSDYQIPYGYSPVIITKNSKLLQNQNAYKGFIKATKQGFLYAQQHQSASIEMLKLNLTPHDLEAIDLEKSLAYTSPYFGDQKSCGSMQETRVTDFLEWLVQNNLEDKKILSQILFTNDLL